MENLSDAEILANRKKVVEYLQKPSLRKAKGALREVGGGRCCLGHMCDILEIPSTFNQSAKEYYYGVERSYGFAPQELMAMVGLHGNDGEFYETTSYEFQKFDRAGSLAQFNDEFRVSPQRIGKILSTMLEGGPGTPWKKITL